MATVNGISSLQKLEEARKGARPRDHSPVLPTGDLWPLQPCNTECLLFRATKVVVICYSRNRKGIHPSALQSHFLKGQLLNPQLKPIGTSRGRLKTKRGIRRITAD